MKKVLVSDEGIDMIKDRDKVIGVRQSFGDYPPIEVNLNNCNSKKFKDSGGNPIYCDDVLIYNKKLCLVKGDAEGLHFFINNAWEDIENTKNRYGYLGVVGDIDNDSNPSMVYIYRKPNSNGKVVVAERKRINGVWGDEEIWNEDDYFYNGYFNKAFPYCVAGGFWYIRPDWISGYTNVWQSNIYPDLWILPASSMNGINVKFYRTGGGKTGSEEPEWNIHFFTKTYSKPYIYHEAHAKTYDNNLRWYLFQKELRDWQPNTYYIIGEFVRLSNGKIARVTNIKFSKGVGEYYVPDSFGEEKNGVYEDSNTLWQYQTKPDWSSFTKYAEGYLIKAPFGCGSYVCVKEGMSGSTSSVFSGCPNSVIDGGVWWEKAQYPSELAGDYLFPLYARKQSSGATYKMIGAKSGGIEPTESGWNGKIYFTIFDNLDEYTLQAFIYEGDSGDIVYLYDNAKSNIGLKAVITGIGGIKEFNYEGISSDYQDFYFQTSDLKWNTDFYCHVYYQVNSPYPTNNIDVDFYGISNEEKYWYPSQEDYRIWYQILNNNKVILFNMEVSEGNEDKLHNVLYKTGEKQTLNFENTWDIYGIDNDGQYCYMSYYTYDGNGFPVDKLVKFNKNGIVFDIDLPMTESGKYIFYRNPALDENYLYLLHFLATIDYDHGKTRIYIMNKTNGEIISTTEVYDENSGKVGDYLLKSTLPKFRVTYQDISDNNYYIDCELRNKGFFPFFIRLCLLNTINIGLRER